MPLRSSVTKIRSLIELLLNMMVVSFSRDASFFFLLCARHASFVSGEYAFACSRGNKSVRTVAGKVALSDLIGVQLR